MRVTLPGGKRVYAEHGGHTIQTDQPQMAGGDGSAPSPFDLFLASIGTCAGFYVLAFCQKREIPTDEIELSVDFIRDKERHMVEQIDIAVSLPASFPERYVTACVKAAEQCTVKRHLQDPPTISLRASRAEA
jgi:ribosomal protein S12 methylthiotransferase accessory factor